MTYQDFIKYRYWLGICLPEEIQKEAISRLVLNITDEFMHELIDWNNSYTWENAVIVIERIGYPRNKLAIDSLLLLLKDVNWFGAKHSCKVIKDIWELDESFISQKIDWALSEAVKQHDDDWVFGIRHLSKFYLQKDIND